MIRLPFKTEPKQELYLVGDEASGTVEIPKLGDLTPNERIFIEEEMKAFPDVRLEGAKLAKTISAGTGISLMEAYDALTRGSFGTLAEHVEEVLGFQDLMERVNTHRLGVTVTAIVRFRLVPDWTLTNTIDPTLMPLKLLREIYQFALNEQSGWTQPEPITEQVLGESLSEEELPSQIGETSSGESELIIPTTSDSVPTDLDSSLVA